MCSSSGAKHHGNSAFAAATTCSRTGACKPWRSETSLLSTRPCPTTGGTSTCGRRTLTSSAEDLGPGARAPAGMILGARIPLRPPTSTLPGPDGPPGPRTRPGALAGPGPAAPGSGPGLGPRAPGPPSALCETEPLAKSKIEIGFEV